MALVLVLIALVLVAGLTIALLTKVRTGKISSYYYEGGVQSRVLADSTMNLVIGQIRDATTDTSQAITWASQPGAIRTYDTSTTGGSMKKAYKLYSSDKMVETDERSLVSDHDPAWQSKTGLYVNLNEPIVKGTNKIYPIIDPAVLQAPDTEKPEGFSVDEADGSYTAGAEDTLAMPVKWLYLLKDGTFAAATYSGDGKVSVAGASATNPIQARVAFWTDDESCKVNINTATEGNYWDMPRVNTFQGSQFASSQWNDTRYKNPTSTLTTAVGPMGTTAPEPIANVFDQAFAFNQPSAREYNRFPGHPATTSLSAVFPSLTPTQIFSIVPRNTLGGSKMGTVPLDLEGSSAPTILKPMPVTLDADRLYSSEGEVLYKAGAATPRQTNEGLTAEKVAQRKFFLTADSRAPELNIFGRPRVAMWPVSDPARGTDASLRDSGRAYRTASDNLIEFCSTIKKRGTTTKWPFIFYRRNAYSATDDANITSNRNLYEYLQDVTSKPVPGFGGTFASKYGVDRDQILTEILDYIRCTNLFDASLEPSSWKQGPTTGRGEFTNGVGNALGSDSTHPSHAGYPGHGQVVPLQMTSSTMGLGRTPTVTEVALHFIATAAPSNNESNDPTKNITLKENGTPLAKLTTGQTRVQAMLEVDMATPMQGYPAMSPSLSIQIEGADQFKVNGQALFPQREYIKTYDKANVDNSGGNANQTISAPFNYNAEGPRLYWGGGTGYIGLGPFLGMSKFSRKGFLGDVTRKMAVDSATAADGSFKPKLLPYPFISDPFTVTGSTIDLPAAELTLTVAYAADGNPSGQVSRSAANSDIVYQTITVRFDAMSIPVPTLAGDKKYWVFNQSGWDGASQGRLKSRGAILQELVQTGDVVRSMQIKDGDFRLNAAMSVVPSSRFELTKGIDNNLKHSLTFVTQKNRDTDVMTVGYQMSAYPLGRSVNNRGLLQSGSYNSANDNDQRPDVPFGYNLPTTADWDNGMSVDLDGPFANMPDVGSLHGRPYYYFDFDVPTRLSALSPNRIVPSSGMLGSLPTGVKSGTPWRTLLFHPDETGNRFGGTNPPDHLIMDLFWMPVAEPYAISDPFSTAGKVNLNYQMLPFTYIKRQTGLYAVMKQERMLSIPQNAGATYKSNTVKTGSSEQNYWRQKIDVDKTLQQFEDKFKDGKIFRTASELCDMYLVPNNATGVSKSDVKSGMRTYWNARPLNGDNSRERPYTVIYPRVTTQSNTYRIHYWVEQVQKNKTTSAEEFIDPAGASTEAKDVVRSRLRGSFLVERFIEPDDPDFGKSGLDPLRDSLNAAYKFRLLGSTLFNP